MEYRSKDPEFNSGIAYLQRISDLMQIAHTFLINDNIESVLPALSSIFTELMPRLSDDEIQGMTKTEIGCQAMNMSRYRHSTDGRRQYLEELQRFFRQLNTAAHKHKLIMRNIADAGDAVMGE